MIPKPSKEDLGFEPIEPAFETSKIDNFLKNLYENNRVAFKSYEVKPDGKRAFEGVIVDNTPNEYINFGLTIDETGIGTFLARNAGKEPIKGDLPAIKGAFNGRFVGNVNDNSMTDEVAEELAPIEHQQKFNNKLNLRNGSNILPPPKESHMERCKGAKPLG